jgi:conjugal transfer pilus assembly protein TraU
MLKKIILIIATTSFLSAGSCGSASNFITVIKDTCYSCIFPLYVAGVPVGTAPVDDDSSKVRSPLCYCGSPIPRVGIPIGYWNPNRFIESVSEPWCFPLVGLSVGVGLGSAQRGAKSTNGHRTFLQTHYYKYPLFYMLDMFTDFVCMTSSDYDIAWIGEIDPTWDDDELSFWINPESLLFSNPASQLACVADSVAANLSTPSSTLFWCKGSWGSLYPVTGSVVKQNFVEDAASASASMMFKLGRMGLLLNGAGNSALCGKTYKPIWNKDNYRLQLMLPQSAKECMVIGKDALFWSAWKNLPVRGVDQFGFLMFQKRDCCMF